MLALTQKLEYCPRCGTKNWERSGEKLYACGHCSFCYFHNVAAAAALIMDIQGKLLFTVRRFDPAKGKLDLPGGFIDYHESAEEGLKREIKEELNLAIETPAYITSFPNRYVYNDIEYHTLDLFFYLAFDTLPEMRVSDDITGYVLLAPGEIDTREIGLESIKNVVNFYCKNKQ